MAAADVMPGIAAIGARTFLCASCGNVELIPAKQAAAAR
jgi:hypothetical protein